MLFSFSVCFVDGSCKKCLTFAIGGSIIQVQGEGRDNPKPFKNTLRPKGKKTMATKTVNYTDTEKKIVEALSTSERALTLAELSEKLGMEIKSGNINALVKKGNVEKTGEREIVVQAKRKVGEYSFVKSI